ncbi:MAG: peptidoglycan-binding protein [Desulfobacteraceae bacterium]|nr:peptidoglycan-binding protein [Desulfobacteraceae bacterium]
MLAKSRMLFGLFLVVAILAFFGCAHTDTDLRGQLMQKDNELQALKSSSKEKDMALEQYETKLRAQSEATSKAEMQAKEAGAATIIYMEAERRAKMEAEEAARRAEQQPKAAPVAMLLPPEAKPGECYARVFIPPKYKNWTETVLKQQASERVETIPARYGTAEEKVLVKEASKRFEEIPAQYKWVEEKVLVEEASTRLEEIPAKYEWVEEKILVKEAHTVWKKGRGIIEKLDNTTGEIMCLVEVPATYRTVKKRVLVTPAAVREVPIPAQYTTIKKRILVTPASMREIEIPAAYKTVKVTKMVSPPQEKRIPISAEYQTITKTERASDGRMEWRRVLCETNVSPGVISKIQNALLRAGHDPGPIDGVIGPLTNAAIKVFQKEKRLAVGALTYETIRSLGVKPF